MVWAKYSLYVDLDPQYCLGQVLVICGLGPLIWFGPSTPYMWTWTLNMVWAKYSLYVDLDP